MSQDFLLRDHQQAEAHRHASNVLRHRPQRPVWREYLETAALALTAAILLRLFVVSAYRVSSASMENTLMEGDYLFVNKLAYEYGSQPKPGDVIVFKYPNNPEKDFIKRIIATPGQTVQVADKVVYVDGQVAKIPDASKNIDPKILSADLSFRDNFGPYVVPEKSYFVMGDNRDDSRDSRFWGSVPYENIRGKAIFIYWSWEPNQGQPSWEFPYVVNLVQWAGYFVWNFPASTRWSRIGNSL